VQTNQQIVREAVTKDVAAIVLLNMDSVQSAAAHATRNQKRYQMTCSQMLTKYEDTAEESRVNKLLDKLITLERDLKEARVGWNTTIAENLKLTTQIENANYIIGVQQLELEQLRKSV
jgi:hypothetical protein